MEKERSEKEPGFDWTALALRTLEIAATAVIAGACHSYGASLVQTRRTLELEEQPINVTPMRQKVGSA